MSASPEHWCRIPELDNLTDLMSLEERKALSLPYKEKPDGRRIYSKCEMYDVNYTEIIEEWLRRASQYNVTDDDVDPSTSSSFYPPPRKLPSPPVSNPDWPVIDCQYGWNYDTRDYDSTLVTEVNSTFSLFLTENARPVCSSNCRPRNQRSEALEISRRTFEKNFIHVNSDFSITFSWKLITTINNRIHNNIHHSQNATFQKMFKINQHLDDRLF